MSYSTVFPCTLATVEEPPGVRVPWAGNPHVNPNGELHTSTVSELSLKWYPMRAVCERGLVHCGISQGDSAQHVYCLGQQMPVKCSGQSLLWSLRREKK